MNTLNDFFPYFPLVGTIQLGQHNSTWAGVSIQPDDKAVAAALVRY
jgi:hypothetical protein